MHRSVVLLLVVAFCAFASAVIDVTTLTTGNINVGVLSPQLSDVTGHKLSYYKIWVPENASSVAVSFNVSDTPDCSYLHVYQRVNGLPCNVDYSDTEFTCYYDAYNPSNGVSGNNEYLHDASTSNVRWAVNTWWYIGVGRYYASDYSKSCSFALRATVTTCPGTQIGSADSSSATCLNAVEQTLAAVTVTQAANVDVIVKRSTAATAGFVNVTITANTTALYIYGRSEGAPYSSSFYADCYTSSYTTVGAQYIYNLECENVRQGTFLYILLTSSSPYTATVDAATTVCSTTTAGNLCLYPLSLLTSAPLTPILLSESLFPNAPGGDFVFFYVDVPAATLTQNLTFTVSANTGTGSGYSYWRRNAFIDYNSYESSDYRQSLSTTTATTFILTEQDLYPGGRYYFAIEAYTGNVTVTLTPTGGITTGSNTGVTGATTTAAASTTASATTTSFATAAATTARPTSATTATGATTGDADSSSATTVTASLAALVLLVATMF